MANTNLIYTYIQDSGYKLQYVASVLHISSNTLRHKLLGETQFMGIILSLAIFGAGMYSYSRLEYGTRDYVLYTASAYLIISAVTISVSFILMMLNSAKKKMKTN